VSLVGLKCKRKVIETKRKKAKNTNVRVTIKNHRDKNGGHPHVILGNIDDNHVSVGLSTKKCKGKGHFNYPLQCSPLSDGKTSYMRKQGTVDKKTSYSNPRVGSMTKDDYEVAKVYGSRAVEKYKNGKKK